MRVRRLTVGPFQSNCYLLGPSESGGVIVIDPGDEGVRIGSAIEETGGAPAAILLTHAHLDHIGAVAHLRRELGMPVYLHPADLPLYGRAAEQGAAFGIAVDPPPPPDRELSNGQTLDVGGFSFEVRHTPGHSPGGVTLVTDGMAFVGDCVFAGSIGRTDLPGGDTDTLLDAILTRILSLPGQTTLWPGHGPETTAATEAAGNPFLAPLMEPCLHCGTPLPLRLYGCKGGHCHNCGHPYPHGDCSDA